MNCRSVVTLYGLPNADTVLPCSADSFAQRALTLFWMFVLKSMAALKALVTSTDAVRIVPPSLKSCASLVLQTVFEPFLLLSSGTVEAVGIGGPPETTHQV